MNDQTAIPQAGESTSDTALITVPVRQIPHATVSKSGEYIIVTVTLCDGGDECSAVGVAKTARAAYQLAHREARARRTWGVLGPIMSAYSTPIRKTIADLHRERNEERHTVAKLRHELSRARSDSEAVALREGMDMIRQHLRPRGYCQPNLLDAVKAACADAEKWRREATLAQSQIEQVKRGYAKHQQATQVTVN